MRGLVSAAGTGWRLLTRTGRDASAAFPELAVLPDLMAGRMSPSTRRSSRWTRLAGRPDFSRLQWRIGVRHPDPGLLRRVPVTLYVFDVLYPDGRATIAEPYLRRRELLAGLDLRAPAIDTPPHFPDAGAEVLTVANERGLEGVVCSATTAATRPAGAHRCGSRPSSRTPLTSWCAAGYQAAGAYRARSAPTIAAAGCIMSAESAQE